MASSLTTTTGEIKRMVTLKMSNNEEFYLEESLAFQSELFKNMVKEKGMSIIQLPNNIKRGTLVTIIEYLKNHAAISLRGKKFKNFKKEHLHGDMYKLRAITMFAHYCKIENLENICCEAIANNIKGKDVDTIRELLGEKDDLTPEEKAEIMNMNAWAFE